MCQILYVDFSFHEKKKLKVILLQCYIYFYGLLQLTHLLIIQNEI